LKKQKQLLDSDKSEVKSYDHVKVLFASLANDKVSWFNVPMNEAKVVEICSKLAL